jgi:hypothetical protein
VNRWARRHATVLERDLDEGESLIAASRAVIVAVSSIAASGRARPRVTRSRGPRPARVKTARRLGFPLPASIFVIGISDRRLLLWETSLLLASPRGLSSSLPLDQVASVRAQRRLGPTRLAVVLDQGALLTVQPLWSGGVADIATAFATSRNVR